MTPPPEWRRPTHHPRRRSNTMTRQLVLLACLLSLWPSKIKVAAVCVAECDSLSVNVTKQAINVQLPGNFTIRNVTFANGTQLFLPLKTPITGLHPGVQYTVHFENASESCCKDITTEPSPVFDIQFANLSSTEVTLTWNNSDPDASRYTYIIEIIKGMDTVRNQTSNTKSVVTGNLIPGTSYTFLIYPRAPDNTTLGEMKTVSVYTKPSPVFDIQFANLSTTEVTLTWNNDDPDSSSYTYIIDILKGMDIVGNQMSNSSSALIGNLIPGTLYMFSIYPQADNGTVGDRRNISIYTKPSPVFDIQFANLSTTEVTLTWNNRDPDYSSYTYIIDIIKGMEIVGNQTSNSTSAVIGSLIPGTSYTFSVYPRAADNTTGDSNNISIYTKPNPVFDIQFANLSTTEVTLTWNNDDPDSSSYTYIIDILKGMDIVGNQMSNSSSALIGNLIPGTLYTFSIYPQADNGTVGDRRNISIYTKPSPVFDIQFANLSTTEIMLTWNNSDPNHSSYTYTIETIKGMDTVGNQTSNIKSAVIGNLMPGTSYTFLIYPRAADNTTEGDPNNISIYTKPSPVFDIQFENLSSTGVTLTWDNSDPGASSYTYIIIKGTDTVVTQTFNSTTAVIGDLIPGTSYMFSIYPRAADNTTEGDRKNISIYTRPNAVSNIAIESISTTEVSLSWNTTDAAASGYSYRIFIEGEGKNQTALNTTARVQNLTPGSSYTFFIFAQVDAGKTEGDPNHQSACTDAATVDTLGCGSIDKQPALHLNWSTPVGAYSGFTITIMNLNNTWNSTLDLSEEKQSTIVTNLSYFASYTVSIVTHSCGRSSLPQERTCLTSITDPPPPSKPPAVEVTSHDSFKVKFSRFDPVNGPLTAYAVIITNSKDIKLNKSLMHTYGDFTHQRADAYVAYIKDIEQRSSASLDSPHYVIEIGNEATTHGYFNGKLEPLGTYRACIAGFTRIDYKTGIIVAEESYVSFSDVSGSVTLPQNPGVIIGAVVGCVLGATFIAAVLGFIFWKKRRGSGNNNDVPFAPIEPKKSKLVKVENFESFFKKQKADSNCGFAEEYEDLRQVGINQPKFAAELTENKGKNRYNNVLSYDISRVKLSVQNHPTNDYINANYMPGYNSKKEFIAAQGPLPNTVQDFWRMIWEKDIYAVVMLTKCVEQGRTKCEEYWPNKQSKTYGDIMVAMTSEIVLPEWTIRDFSMEKSESPQNHPVRQFHFTAWPDHGVPETTDLLISFRHVVQEYMKQNPTTSPTLVHCSAGVGRTGTFIALDRLLHQMERENTVDIYGAVYELRMHRPLMVQTEDQYVFLNQCVLDIIKSKKEKTVDLIYQNTTAMAIYENFKPSPSIKKANGYHE